MPHLARTPRVRRRLVAAVACAFAMGAAACGGDDGASTTHTTATGTEAAATAVTGSTSPRAATTSAPPPAGDALDAETLRLRAGAACERFARRIADLKRGAPTPAALRTMLPMAQEEHDALAALTPPEELSGAYRAGVEGKRMIITAVRAALAEVDRGTGLNAALDAHSPQPGARQAYDAFMAIDLPACARSGG